MVLTQKETMLLEDLKSQEQLCIEKYNRYASEASDGQLKALFTQLRDTEQQHLNTVTQMLAGTVPTMSGGSSKTPGTPTPSKCTGEQKQKDGYLCSDALSTEKHVASVYDTSIFEFKDENARNTLNHIQKEEQQHGKYIYDYMAVNGLYS